MRHGTRPSNTARPLTVPPVYLAASAVNNLVRGLPAGTAYFIGIVFLTMFTGQLVHYQGSLARAALPYVLHLRWGWHRVERAMERGKVSLDTLFDRALTWCLEYLPVEPVRLGKERRTVHAIDSSTVARLRANKKRCALLGKRLLPSGSAGGAGQSRRRAYDRGADRWGTGRLGAPDSLRSDVPRGRGQSLCCPARERRYPDRRFRQGRRRKLDDTSRDAYRPARGCLLR